MRQTSATNVFCMRLVRREHAKFITVIRRFAKQISPNGKWKNGKKIRQKNTKWRQRQRMRITSKCCSIAKFTVRSHPIGGGAKMATFSWVENYCLNKRQVINFNRNCNEHTGETGGPMTNTTKHTNWTKRIALPAPIQWNHFILRSYEFRSGESEWLNVQ